MWTQILLVVAAGLKLAEGSCLQLHNEIHYYESLGCTAQGLDEHACPKSYDCSVLERRSKDKCHLKNESYEVGHTLEPSSAHSCLTGCQCINDGTPKFECIHIECPSEVGRPVGPGCYRTHEHGRCCHVKEICPPQDVKSSVATCHVDGHTYREGEEFYPQDGHCVKCLCQPGFNGSLVAPWCRPVNCQLDLVDGDSISEGCAPIFYGSESCCPIEWRCPNGTGDAVHEVLSTKATTSSSESNCKFGELTLKVGERLNDDPFYRNVICKCSVPPHVVCVKNKRSPSFKNYY